MVQEQSTKHSLPPASVSGEETAACIAPPARVVCTASCDLHQQRARVQRERGYIITAIGKRSSLRCDGSATAGGCFRVGCHGDTLGPLPRGCSLEYPPSCLFSAIPSSPSFPPSTISSLRLSLRFSLFHRCHRSHRLRFSPPYTYVFTRPPSLPTTLLIALCRPFRLFCSQVDSLSTEATVAGFGLSSFPSFSDI